MRSLPGADSAFLLVTHEEKCGRSEKSDHEHDFIVGDKVGINHQANPEQHRFPEVHSLAVNERDETDRPEDNAADQVCRTEVQHLDQVELDAGQDRPSRD